NNLNYLKPFSDLWISVASSLYFVIRVKKANNGMETNSESNYNIKNDIKDDDIEDDNNEDNDSKGSNILIKNLLSLKLYWTPKKCNSYTSNSRATKY
ncbi:3120_t:CDS:2, partial [Diversispora eburnea]